jgi:SAM-dependent methyltransferase
MSTLNKTYTEGAYFTARLPYDSQRERLWPVLCDYLQRDVPKQGSVLELGGGYCYFINHIQAAERFVLDLYPEIRSYAAPGVTPLVQSCTDLTNFKRESLDVVFASNLFEHLTREDLDQTLAGVRDVLRPGGKLLIIQPNFKYCYREYFDDYTHLQIFTDTSLADLLTVSGFQVEKMIPRFLPFSVKTGGPKWPSLLRLYLTLPWRPFAGQMYIVAKKCGGSLTLMVP